MCPVILPSGLDDFGDLDFDSGIHVLYHHLGPEGHTCGLGVSHLAMEVFQLVLQWFAKGVELGGVHDTLGCRTRK
jgi:hypothetical protein